LGICRVFFWEIAIICFQELLYSGEQEMKALKIAAIAVFAVMAVALVATAGICFPSRWMGTSPILSYSAQPSVTTPTTASSTVYSAEPVLTTASAVTTPIYYPTCCSTWYNGYEADDCYDGYYGCGGCGRHGGYWGYGYGTAPIYGAYTTPLTISQAVAAANEYLASLNNPNLAIANVQEYAVNFRFALYEKNSGVGAYEMTINKYTGYVYPGMGPSVTWNTKYGIVNGVLTIYNATAKATMPVTAAQAQSFAQQYLSTVMPATTVGNTTPFYGYYNVEVLSGGNMYGVLSVNGYTGQIWCQAWLGSFVQQTTP
jgi:hypothetical protein